MSDNKSRDIFYGVVAVATLIIALIGATLAYFSITASSETGAVNAQAAIVSIDYNDGQQVTASADKLIPSSLDVVKTVYLRNQENFGEEGAMRSNICVDDKNQQVCSIYRFSIKSDVTRDFTAVLSTESNDFTYLAYAVRDVNNDTWVELDSGVDWLPLAGCDQDDSTDIGECYSVDGDGNKTYSTTPQAINSIFGYNGTNLVDKSVGATIQVYDIVIFLKENNRNQNVDQGRQYSGTIYVETTDSSEGIITGTLNP